MANITTILTAQIITALPDLDEAVARAFARAASHPDLVAEGAEVLAEAGAADGDVEWAIERAEDVAWQWAHATSAHIAHAAYQEVPSARRERGGEYSLSLQDGAVVFWAGDENREGDPVPALTWTVYDAQGAVLHADGWVGGALRTQPSAQPFMDALRASIRPYARPSAA